MRTFSCYLYENFDPEAYASNTENPRNFLNEAIYPVLSRVADGQCSSQEFSSEILSPLITGGILRAEKGSLFFDTPVFLKEDAAVLQQFMAEKGSVLAMKLSDSLPALRQCCAGLNDFSPEINLYHLLCGMVFDGLFFDYLSQQGIVVTSRMHPSGLDYLSILYETCPELDVLSDRLLCSYNRFTDGSCSLQSFGDADGNRFDFYRVSRQMEMGIPALSDPLPSKGWLLSQVRELAVLGNCHPDALSLLEQFCYVQNGRFCVPVYGTAAEAAARQMETIVEQSIGDTFANALSSPPLITATRHGVAPGEIANELYHILFGSVNEALCSSGAVTTPPHIPGQGRFLRCVLLDI